MVNYRKIIVAAVAATVLAFSVTGCFEKEGPAEKAGKSFDKSMDKAGREIDRSVEKAGREMDKAGEKFKDLTNDE